MPARKRSRRARPLEVQVVRRLVEEEHVEAREQDRGECGARRLPTGERPERGSERGRRQTRFGDGRPRARVQVVASEREEAVERLRVLDRELGLRVEAARERVEPAPGFVDPRAPGQIGEQRLVGPPIGLLRQIPDRQTRSRLDRAAVR